MRRISFTSPIPFPSALLAIGCVQMTCMPAVRGQSMMEAGAAVAGSTVGSVAGKQVSNGVTAIFGKTAKQAEKAANSDKPATAAPADSRKPLLEVGTGVPAPEQPVVVRKVSRVRRPKVEQAEEPYNVPPPPPPRNVKPVKVRRPEPVLQAMARPVEAPVVVPKPVVTSDVLSGVAVGTPRKDLLSLGAPSARITMQQDGHMLEVYDYMGHDNPIGVVHLIDGVVNTVDIRK